MKYMKRSRYLTQKTNKYSSWVLHDKPIKNYQNDTKEKIILKIPVLKHFYGIALVMQEGML